MRTCFLIVLSALLLSGNTLKAQSGTFDPEIRKLFLNLDTVNGNRLLMQRYAVNSPQFIRIISYRDFLFNLLYQSKTRTGQYFNRSDDWLSILDKVKPVKGFSTAAIAEIYLYRAILGGVISDYKAAASGLLSCYKVVSRSGEEFTTSDRNKLSGILGILFQMVPGQYLKYIRILGVRPSGLSGYNGLERYYTSAAPGSVEKMEGYLLMIISLKEFNQEPSAAWDFIRSEGNPMLENPLIRYRCALAALKAGYCEEAIGLLDHRRDKELKAPFPYWDYQYGEDETVLV